MRSAEPCLARITQTGASLSRDIDLDPRERSVFAEKRQKVMASIGSNW